MVPNNKRNETQHIKQSGNDKPKSFWQGYVRTRRPSSLSRLVARHLIAVAIIVYIVGVLIIVEGIKVDNATFSEIEGYTHYYEGVGEAISLGQYFRERGYYPKGTRSRYVYSRDDRTRMITIRVEGDYCYIGDASGEIAKYPYTHPEPLCRITRIYERGEDERSDHPGVDFVVLPRKALMRIAGLVKTQGRR